MGTLRSSAQQHPCSGGFEMKQSLWPWAGDAASVVFHLSFVPVGEKQAQPGQNLMKVVTVLGSSAGSHLVKRGSI